MMEMIRSRPDGHTLILCSVGAATLTPNLSDAGYTYKDVIPISQLTELSTGIIVTAESGITNLAEFIAASEANFGKKTFSTSGTGSIHHLAAELFMKEIGKPGLITHVPFNSGTEATAALLGNQVNFSFGDPADGLPLIKEGRLRMIATATYPGRDPFLPDVPSFRELGYNVPQMGPWTALAAPAGTPEEVITKLDKTVKEIMELPSVLGALDRLSLAPAYMNRADITEKWITEYYQNKALIAGLRK